jgi:hypothetical protein
MGTSSSWYSRSNSSRQALYSTRSVVVLAFLLVIFLSYFVRYITTASLPMKRLNIAGFSNCGYFRGTVEAVKGLRYKFPEQISLAVHEYKTRDAYMDWLAKNRESFGAKYHRTSPFVWVENDVEDGYLPHNNEDPDFAQHSSLKYLGGHDDTIEWGQRYLAKHAVPIQIDI